MGLRLILSGIQDIPQAVPQQVEDHHSQKDSKSWKYHQPRRRFHIGPSLIEHISPLNGGRLGTQAQEGEAGQLQHHPSHIGGSGDDQGGKG